MSDPNLIILSTKDKKSIARIIEYEKFIINNNNIFGYESFKIKSDIFIHFQEKNNISAIDTYFIDDNIENLLSAQNLGINVFLASWGYVNNVQIDIAKRHNIPMLKINDFENWYYSIKNI